MWIPECGSRIACKNYGTEDVTPAQRVRGGGDQIFPHNIRQKF